MTSKATISFLLLSVVLTAVGCAGLRPNLSSSAPPEGRVITAEDVRASGARTAWEALRRAGVHLTMTESRTGRPTGVASRGRSSLNLDQTPVVVVDGIRIVDFRSLYDIPGNAVEQIQVLNGIEGTRRYGTGAGNGVIIVRTRGAMQIE